MKYSIDYLELRQLNFITLINFNMKSKLATYANFSEIFYHTSFICYFYVILYLGK